MSRTYRNLPNNAGRSSYHRTPRHRHRLLAGESSKVVVTDWDDKPVAARKEAKHQS